MSLSSPFIRRPVTTTLLNLSIVLAGAVAFTMLAVSPLLDERATSALLDLRARGFDLAVIEVSPVEYVAPGPSESDRVGHRLWSLKREAQRTRYERAGVPVAIWSEDTSLAGALEEVKSFRRYARSAR